MSLLRTVQICELFHWKQGEIPIQSLISVLLLQQEGVAQTWACKPFGFDAVEFTQIMSCICPVHLQNFFPHKKISQRISAIALCSLRNEALSAYVEGSSEDSFKILEV